MEHALAYEAIRQLIGKLSSQPDLYSALKVADDGAVTGRFYEFELASHFQSIVRLDKRETIGYDAYARSHGQDGGALSPWGLFSRAADDATVVKLDRLCRLVHTINYFSQPGSDVPLYLRVHGRLLAAITQDHGRAFRRMLDALGLCASDVVLQLPIEATSDVLLVGVILGNYRKSGFKVGVMAASAQHAQSLIHLHAPDVVKIAMNALAEPERHVSDLLATANRRSTQLVFTRLEDEDMVAALRQWGAEFGQGYLFDMPRARLVDSPGANRAMPRDP